ncbi:alpha/beta fold hydrolase [Nocardia acidivorans]|uniref:alpha/beta fold hydrolase n=1 Tax=Nocardia acidivorans TaxID=404580 RepID=UPI00083359CB|nr:alpha/beta hydrolase [Nocardia acidivorans]
MSVLAVPGAEIYYESAGSGSALLLIGGGTDDARDLAGIAAELTDRYTVIGYDPRGISRSIAHERPDTVPSEVDDAHRVLRAVTDGPADVFATSAGVPIALALATAYPEMVRTVVAHEPATFALLAADDPRRWLYDEVYRIYRREGAAAAMGRFVTGAGLGGRPGNGAAVPESPEAAESLRQRLERVRHNADTFLAHRLVPICGYEPDLDALRATGIRIVVGVGAASGGSLPADTALALGRALGAEPVTFPGGHAGAATHPAAFALRLRELLAD